MNIKVIEDLHKLQNTFFSSGKTMSLDYRIKALRRFASLIEEHTERIIEALERDLKKPATEAFTSEVMVIRKDIDIALRQLRKWSSPIRIPTPLMQWPAGSFSVPEPRGAALVLGPWNYPFALTLTPLVSALAAGNCVVIKPSEISGNSSRLLEELISSCFEPGHVSVVQGGVDIAGLLLARRWDSVFLTGGIEAGRQVMRACAEHLSPVTLELGGKNPCIAEKDIDLKKTARRIAWGKFFNAGQTCTAPDYLCAHGSVKDDLIDEIERAILTFYGSNPQISPHYARIVNKMHLDRLRDIIGSSVVAVGGMVDEEELYVAPTVLKDIDWDCRAMEAEIFGPVLPVLEFQELDEVIAELRGRPSPLALYFFSRDREKQKRIMREIRSGSICFNNILGQVMNRRLPFGGVGHSGMGQYHGKAGYDTFTQYRGVVRRGFNFDSSFMYPPYKTPLKTLKRILPFLFR